MRYWEMLTPYGQAWVSAVGLALGALVLIG